MPSTRLRLPFERLIAAGLILIAGGLASPTAFAHHLLPQVDLRCSTNFKCPEALHPRVQFWVSVFSRWDKHQAILHDSRYPFRVYAVLDTGHGCGRAARKQIKRARDGIRADLRRLADQLAKGQGRIPAGNQVHLLELFPERKPGQLRASANNLRCQTGVRDQFEAALPRFERYRGVVDAVLKRHNLPPELRYLPFVESSYNPRAYSKAGAAGLWQLMPAAARENGLELNATLDERLDVAAATEAAARYLVKARRSLTGVARKIDPGVRAVDLNPFIITSYNYGVNGMRRAINQHGPNYLTVLNRYKSPSFQVAVKNFYSSFLAASHLAGSDEASGRLRRASPNTQTIVLNRDTSAGRLQEVFGLSVDELRSLNPGLSRYVWENWRLIPAGYGLQVPAREGNWQTQTARLARLQAEPAPPASGRYRVRRGDTACGIARALRVNCGLLMEVNRLNSRGDIQIDQRLLIPQSSAIGSAEQYRVRSGDTACGIAKRHSVSCRELVALNQLGRKARIFPGQVLALPQTALARATRDGLDEQGFYVVRRGDSVCKIARRYQLHCPAVQEANRLAGESKIFPGQKLVLPGLTAVPDPVAAAAPADHPLDELPDLAIRVTERDGAPRYSVRVEPEETLGYYADWAGLGSSAVLRRDNNLGGDSVLHIGRRIDLPLTDANQVARFEERRREFHQTLSDGLKANYAVAEIVEYKVRSGDTPADLAREREFPLWLLYRLNPQLHDGSLQVGQILRLPELVARG